MADENNVQELDANKPAEQDVAAEPIVPAADEHSASDPASDGTEVNGAADGAPAADAPAAAPEAEASPAPVSEDPAPAIEVPAGEQPAGTEETATPTPGAPFTDAPAGGDANAAEAAPASEPAPELATEQPVADGGELPASDVPVAAEPAASTDAPNEDTSVAGNDVAPAPVGDDQGGVSPIATDASLSPELSTSSMSSDTSDSSSTATDAGTAPAPADADKGSDEAELPYNNTGMAQLGTTGHETGGPLEHPAPAAIPRPIDPTTGLELSDEDHEARTGGLSKGDSVDVPKAPVNENDSKSEDSAAATAQAPSLDDEEGLPSSFGSDENDVSDESAFEKVKDFLEGKLDALLHRIKHVEHQLHEALRHRNR